MIINQEQSLDKAAEHHDDNPAERRTWDRPLLNVFRSLIESSFWAIPLREGS